MSFFDVKIHNMKFKSLSIYTTRGVLFHSSQSLPSSTWNSTKLAVEANYYIRWQDFVHFLVVNLDNSIHRFLSVEEKVSCTIICVQFNIDLNCLLWDSSQSVLPVEFEFYILCGTPWNTQPSSSQPYLYWHSLKYYVFMCSIQNGKNICKVKWLYVQSDCRLDWLGKKVANCIQGEISIHNANIIGVYD